jgi:hypothetical protein
MTKENPVLRWKQVTRATRSVLLALSVLGLMLVPIPLAGASSATARAPGVSGRPSARASAAHISPLVGMWQKTNTCAELLQALTKAGLAHYAPQMIGGSGLINGPMNQPPPDPTHPCANATPPKKHSHLFSRDGRFASFDEQGMQVDDATYTLKNNHTFVMGNGVVVHFQVRGKAIKFYPVINITNPCSKHCHVNDLGWAVSAFYPGAAWHRSAQARRSSALSI